MRNQLLSQIRHLLIAGSVGFFVGTVALSQTTTPGPNPQQRQKMSEMHKKMGEMHSKLSACLESGKPIAECQQDMRTACSANFGESCPLMGKGAGQGMGQGAGPGRGRGMMTGAGACMNWMLESGNEADVPASSKKPVK